MTTEQISDKLKIKYGKNIFIGLFNAAIYWVVFGRFVMAIIFGIGSFFGGVIWDKISWRFSR